jgi:hypothetical protein
MAARVPAETVSPAPMGYSVPLSDRSTGGSRQVRKEPADDDDDDDDPDLGISTTYPGNWRKKIHVSHHERLVHREEATKKLDERTIRVFVFYRLGTV